MKKKSPTYKYSIEKAAKGLFVKYSSQERKYLNQRLSAFKASIKKYFADEVSDVRLFGSYTRGTMLPRQFDQQSDIDILIIFAHERREYTPETYRNQLRKFAVTNYFNSKVVKDHPSVVLQMTDIMLDLVPCKKDHSFWSGTTYQIPDKDGAWVDTDPDEFNSDLTKANQAYNNVVKPIVRLLKCWNAKVGYPYRSFELEQSIASMNFNGDTLASGLLYAIGELDTTDLSIADTKKVETLKSHAEKVQEYLDQDEEKKATRKTMSFLGLQ